MGMPISPELMKRISTQGTTLAIGLDCATCGALMISDGALVTFEYVDGPGGRMPVVNLSGFTEEEEFECGCGGKAVLYGLEQNIHTEPGDPGQVPE